MADSGCQSPIWSRWLIVVLGLFVLLHALGAWAYWYDYQISQPIRLPLTFEEFVFPVTYSVLGVTLIVLGFRSTRHAIRNLAFAVVAVAAIFISLDRWSYQQAHRYDYGDPNDLFKPFRYGGMTWNPGIEQSNKPSDKNE